MTYTKKILAIALVAFLGGIATPPDALAVKTAKQRAEERRAKMEKQSESEESESKEAAAAKYPGATREEPEATASAKMAEKMQAMFDAYEAGDSAKATQVADEILADGDANAYEHAWASRMAGASLLNDDNTRAQAYFEKALQFNGLNNNDHYDTMKVVSQLQLQSEDYTAALATIDRFLAETKATDASSLSIKGNALYRLERHQEAATVLKQAFDASPEPDPQITQLLMAAYSESGQADQAAKLAEQIGNQNPDDPRSQLNLAATYLQAGEDAKAMAILEKLRAQGQLTDESDYRNLYAMYANAEGKEKEAIAVINEGLQKGILKPDHGTYNALAQAYYFSGQTPQAIENFRKAAPLAKDGETYLNLARALNNEGRSAEARQAAEQALAKGIGNPEDARRIIKNNP